MSLGEIERIPNNKKREEGLSFFLQQHGRRLGLIYLEYKLETSLTIKKRDAMPWKTVLCQWCILYCVVKLIYLTYSKYFSQVYILDFNIFDLNH
jgi:hypothetical protein